ncbi:MAG: hypothetical protein WBF39_05920 [Planococcus donghaensis]|uniref:hypothetical protein n=1 Tax=Planococcus sp. APC 3906 TaxID=3035194 RepID=UPI0025B45686|nr:hypothetical protein [Planococcus sp. APC 3906]MDN3451811.1 hypothetical protein [Planococcus sp. APC 3906]
MGKLNALSFLFFFIALTMQIIDAVLEYGNVSIDFNYYYDHFLQWVLLAIVGGPGTGFILAIFGKKGNPRLIAITANAIFFVIVAPLGLLNLWIMTFGK